VGTFDASAYGAGFPGFYLNYSYFDEASAFGHGIIHYYLVAIDDPHQATQISKQIDALFANSANETQTQTESGLVQMQLKQLGDINFIANAIVGAVMFTLLFLTANTMMQSVRERTSELAVLKTIGFSSTSVLGMVLAESVLLLLLGGLIGLALVSLIGSGLPAMSGGMINHVNVGAKSWSVGIGLAIAIGLIIGVLPAMRAMRLNIVDALAGR
jgi:putative ABC transport system permease protein